MNKKLILIAFYNNQMAVTILMPALSPTMTEGKLARWLKQEGDKVKPGELIAEIETDKAVMEVEASDPGIIAKILVGDGSANIAVNQVIGILREKNDSDADIASFIAEHSGATGPKPQMCDISEQTAQKAADESKLPMQTTMSEKQASSVGATVVPAQETRIFASPLARRVADNYGIGLADIAQGSGPNGRIVRQDVVEFMATSNANNNKSAADLSAQHEAKIGAASLAPSAEPQLLPISPMRKAIALRLCESKQQIPHFYIDMSCDMTKLVALREEMNALINNMQNNAQKPLAAQPTSGGAEGKALANIKVSVNDLVVRAVAVALREFPAANVAWSNEGIWQFSDVDIAVAVAINDGLVTPIVRQADKLSIPQLSREIKQLVQKANSNSLRAKEIQGGSITISNLGMYGVENFKAIINPPQASILAVGGIYETPVVRNGGVVIAPVMQLSLSCDHRVIDGAVAAKFLGQIRHHLENPLALLI